MLKLPCSDALCCAGAGACGRSSRARFDTASAAILCNFSELVVRELEVSAQLHSHMRFAHMLKRAADCYKQPYLFVDVSVPLWSIEHTNQAFTECTGALCTACLISVILYSLLGNPTRLLTAVLGLMESQAG